MSDKKTSSGKHQKQPFDTVHLSPLDNVGDNPLDISVSKGTDDAPDHLSAAEQEHAQNQRAEQQLKQQQHQQDERSAFQPGSAQTHQQGNNQRK